jgi:hypothetical protein
VEISADRACSSRTPGTCEALGEPGVEHVLGRGADLAGAHLAVVDEDQCRD